MVAAVVLTELRLRLAPLAVLFVVVLTAVPLELRGYAAWDVALAPGDIIQNLLLFVPLGLALRGWSIARVALAAVVLSSFVEFTQLWSLGRFASPVDVLSNTAGAMLATLSVRRVRGVEGRPFVVRLPGATIASIVTVAGLLVGLWAVPPRASDLSIWDPALRLHVGNEGPRDRGWRGTISEIELLSPVGKPLGTALESPMAFDGTNLEILADTLGSMLYAATREQSSFGLRVMVTPTFIHHEEFPATIISYSRAFQTRNFALEQHDVRLVFRVNTPTTTPSGRRSRAISVPVLEHGRQAEIVATFDGAVSRIAVNGRLAARSNLAAGGCTNTQVCDIAAPTVWALFGAAVALLTLLFAPASSAAGDLLRVNLVTAVGILGVAFLPAFPIAKGTYGHLPLVALVGASLVAHSLARESTAASGRERRLALPS